MAAKNMEEIGKILKDLRFRKQLFGGLSEADVWKKLEMLQREYRSAFDACEAAFQARLEMKEREIEELKKKVRA